MEELIRQFLAVNYGSGSGDGSGNGYGSGSGSGSGSGYGYGYGSGDGSGDGSGSGSGDGSGSGSGSGYGSGNGNGYGYGSGYGYGIKSLNGKQVHIIDSVQTIIESVHDSYARGYILNKDLTLTPCYIAKVGDYFAHGATLKQAVEDATAKYEKNKPITERIADFKKQYPTLDSIAKGADLFRWHNTLTGSCRLGREQFCQDHDIDPDKVTMTVREFLTLTKNAYGKDIIKQVKKAY